jgi:hypothetical protein
VRTRENQIVKVPSEALCEKNVARDKNILSPEIGVKKSKGRGVFPAFFALIPHYWPSMSHLRAANE